MRAKAEPYLFTHRDVATLFNVDTETLRAWIAIGAFPRPHSTIERTTFFKRTTIEHYLAHGEWPESATFTPGEGHGRKAPG